MSRLSRAGLLILLTGQCFGQSTLSNPNQSESTTLHTTSRLVIVPALVQTPTREVIYSLTAADFLLTDNGIAQKVTLDPSTTQPLSLVVLMQTGGSAVHELDKYQNFETMLSALLGDPPNQVSIVNFDSKPEAASPFTSDISQWTDAINHPDPGDSGAAIFDSLKFSLDLLNHEPPTNRRAILLVCQPQDVGSKISPQEVLRIAAETNTAIYTLTFSPQKTTLKDSFKEKPHGNPPIQVGNATYTAYFNLSEPLGMLFNAMRKNAAAELATLSGGEAATFDNQHQLDDRLATFATHMRNRYLLTFTPTSSKPGPHAIQVRVINHPDLIVSARTGYRLAPQDEQQ